MKFLAIYSVALSFLFFIASLTVLFNDNNIVMVFVTAPLVYFCFKKAEEEMDK